MYNTFVIYNMNRKFGEICTHGNFDIQANRQTVGVGDSKFHSWCAMHDKYWSL